MPNPTTQPRHNGPDGLISPRRCLLVAIVFFAAMLAAGAIPGQAQAASAVVNDKLLHFIAYAFLSVPVYGALRRNPAPRALLTLLAVGFLGAVDEALQALLPFRHANWADWEVDMLASMSCVVLLMLLQPLFTALARSARPERGSTVHVRPFHTD